MLKNKKILTSIITNCNTCLLQLRIRPTFKAAGEDSALIDATSLPEPELDAILELKREQIYSTYCFLVLDQV